MDFIFVKIGYGNIYMEVEYHLFVVYLNDCKTFRATRRAAYKSMASHAV